MQERLIKITIRSFCYFHEKFRGLEMGLRDISGLYKLVDTYVKQVETTERATIVGDARFDRL